MYFKLNIINVNKITRRQNIINVNNMTKQKIRLDYESWFDRLKRLERAGVRTIPSNNGLDLIDSFQPECDPKYKIINYKK